MRRTVSRRGTLRALGVGALTLSTGCIQRLTRGPPPDGPTVVMGDDGFVTSADTFLKYVPDRLVVDQGQTVTWWNREEDQHTVTAYEARIPDDAAFFDSTGYRSEEEARTSGAENMTYDDRFEHTFQTPGHYRYFCVPHEGWNMVGTVVVRDAGGNAPSAPPVVRPETDHVVQMTADSFVPETLTVGVGESVGWVNGTGIAHSVTADEGRIPDVTAYFASGGFDTEEAARADWEGPREGDVTHNQPYTNTFETPGEYDYFCILHEEPMRGTVRVVPESEADTGAVPETVTRTNGR